MINHGEGYAIRPVGKITAITRLELAVKKFAVYHADAVRINFLREIDLTV